MTEPTSMDQLAVRQLENTSVSGQGTSTAQHFPCPFCGSKDWYVVRVIEFAQNHGPIECSECGRSAKLLYSTKNGGPMRGGSSQIEVVQTGGPDQPEWLEPKMRDCRAPR